MSENKQRYDGGSPWVWGYVRGGLIGATVVDGELVPEEAVQFAVYGWDESGAWAYKGEADIINLDEHLTAADGYLMCGFLDWDKGAYHPFPGCGATTLTVPESPA